MNTLRTVTIAAALVLGATSLAAAQNGLPTGNEHPVAGGAAGGPSTTHKSKTVNHKKSSALSNLILAQNQPNTGAAGNTGGDSYGKPYSGSKGSRENTHGY